MQGGAVETGTARSEGPHPHPYAKQRRPFIVSFVRSICVPRAGAGLLLAVLGPR